ncbi:hypothetical protein MAPG_06031 [Magnaporthiopsis poae ATCC 64411]|uniref:Uncharacterized protein n=1 Tax=Magnaporthiopsis poae (strain ATCC 64411 / 73-15) TaxID=644358 RepID=A0A0C4E0Y9_MAGP6|nr:hypothetical protein MAPG_06031 [Magnaporthiopsis poae ATCC 64411]
MVAYMTKEETARQAFFAIKYTMFALKYASRVSKYIDTIEDNMVKDKSFKYEKQQFSTAWESMLMEQSQRSLAKAIGWLEVWGPRFVNKYKKQGTPPMTLTPQADLEKIRAGDPIQNAPESEDNDDELADPVDPSLKDGIPPWSPSYPNPAAGPVNTPSNPTRESRTLSAGSTDEVINVPLPNPFEGERRPVTKADQSARGSTQPGTAGQDNGSRSRQGASKPTQLGQPDAAQDPNSPPSPKKPTVGVEDLENKLKNLDLSDYPDTPSKEGAAGLPLDAKNKFVPKMVQLAQYLEENLTAAFIADICARWNAAGKFYGWNPSGGGSAGGSTGGGAKGGSSASGGKGGGTGGSTGGSTSGRGTSGTTSGGGKGGGSTSGGGSGGGGKGGGGSGSAQGQTAKPAPPQGNKPSDNTRSKKKGGKR